MFNKAGWMKSLAVILELGLAMIVPALLGIWIGQKTTAEYGSLFGLLIGLIIGGISVYNLVKRLL